MLLWMRITHFMTRSLSVCKHRSCCECELMIGCIPGLTSQVPDKRRRDRILRKRVLFLRHELKVTEGGKSGTHLRTPRPMDGLQRGGEASSRSSACTFGLASPLISVDLHTGHFETSKVWTCCNVMIIPTSYLLRLSFAINIPAQHTQTPLSMSYSPHPYQRSTCSLISGYKSLV